MAKNNQANGQSGEPSVSFDSNKIAEKERVEQFTNISGEKERQAAAERAKRAAEKKQEAIRNAKIEQEIETRKAIKGSKKPLIAIIVAVILVVAACLVYFFVINKHEPTTEEKISTAKAKAEDINKFVQEKMQEENLNSSREQIEERFDKELNEAKNDFEKYYILIQYANYEFVYTGDNDSVEGVISRIDELNYRDESEEYKCMEVLYRSNNEAWAEENADLIDKCFSDGEEYEEE